MIWYDSKDLKKYNFLVKFCIELIIQKNYNNYSKYLKIKLWKRGDSGWKHIFFQS